MIAPWSGWQPATCMPGRCFCEAIGDGWIRQPANATSSLAFVVVAIIISIHAIRHNRTAYAAIYVFALLFIGSGSAFYHASLTFVGQFADVFGMYLLGSFILLYPLARRWNLPGLSMAIFYVELNGGLVYVLLYYPGARRYLFAALIIPALVLEMKQRIPSVQRNVKWLRLSAALMTIGFAIWSLDITHIVCAPASVWQGHAAWHILGALAALALYAYYSNASAGDFLP